MLRLTNTLTGKKEEFRPLASPRVTLYVCGVTVYDDCHVGHARGAVVFDLLCRFLKSRGFQVTYVRNITDVDDKIIDRARQEPEPGDLKVKARAVAERYTQRFQEDFRKLGLLSPDEEPKATQFISQMIAFIQALITRGVAYEGVDGVYFEVRGIARMRGRYGDLSHQNLDQMLEGVRAEPGEGKKDPLDFALWKKAKPDEPNWPSPWGPGRPGWHIECSAMAAHLLGDQFDIHGGGRDLVFPHHENELAQAWGAGKPFANLWLHHGLLTVSGQKMSKSLGNFVTVQEALRRYPAEVLRLFFLSAHYRSPIDFSWDRMEEARHAYERLTTFLAHCEASPLGGSTPSPGELESQFLDAMEDDLNTPRGLACLFEAVGHPGKELGQVVRRMGQILGLFQAGAHQEVDAQAQQMARERDQARVKKDFAAADRLRKELTGRGYIVEDTSAGTIIRKRS